MFKYHDNSSYRGSLESSSPLNSHPFLTSKFAVPKTPTSPPGFSLPSRLAQPRFPSHGAINYYENHLMQITAPSSRKVGSSVEVEFIDPAMMEVGCGMLVARLKNPGFDMRPALSSCLSPFDHDTQFQMLV